MAASPACSAAGLDKGRRRLILVTAALALLALMLPATYAFAGQASSGELAFYPCTSCHPVTLIPGTETPTRPLPNGMSKHKIVLESHDKLGAEGIACLECHDSPTKNPGRLKTVGGAFVDIKGDISMVCYRCHSAKYKEWKAGVHGRNQAKCTAAGCHDAHTPGWIYAGPLLPFLGSGFQFKVLPERAAFAPLAPPPAPAPVETPTWLMIAALVIFVAIIVLASRLVPGRRNR